MIPGFEGEQGFIRMMRQLGYMAEDSLKIRGALINLRTQHNSDKHIDDICEMFRDMLIDGMKLSDAYFVINIKLSH